MDAEKLGGFIAGRRRELGLTQAQLAEQLHVTDKAVSRWERGVGLPDINNIEPLAQALDVSLVELMRAKMLDDESIGLQEAESLVEDVIRFPRTTGMWQKVVGSAVLVCFAVVSVLLLMLVFSTGGAHLSVSSIISGLIAWGIPIWCLTFGRCSTGITVSLSFAFAMTAVVIQVVAIAGSAYRGDFASIEDTVNALVLVCIVFSLVTLFLNVVSAAVTLRKKTN